MWVELAESFYGLSTRLRAFHELLESGSARLMIALAHIAMADEVPTKQQPLKAT